MSSDEEPDYMSDDFLAKCVPPEDVRPSLVYRPGDKRKHEVEKRKKASDEANKARWKPLRVQEKEARDAGLKKEIGADNKGFQLLAKMGYKPGTSIGKTNEHLGGGDKAIKEPISIEIKTNRVGLGKKTKDQEQMKKAEERRAEFQRLADPNQFRQRILAMASQKDTERDIRKAQSSCRTLDIQKGIETPQESWFWPKPEKVKKLVDDDDEEDSKKSLSATVVDEDDSSDEEEKLPELSDQLKILTEYLRSNYFYCIWCGTSYESTADLQASCPGTSKDDH